MIYFECDYNEGAHPKLLEALTKTNFEQLSGYSEDKYCEKARDIIKKLCKNDELDVHFLVGGTQANLTVISSILRPYQGVVAADTGHINTHETGAIEATGHKVLTIPNKNGKITAKQVEEVCSFHANDVVHEHTVQPGMVYISSPTECGTVYTKQELTDLRSVCDKYDIPMFLDGARLGYGMVSKGNDVTMQDLANLCDAFYIGGTKVGALCGEAVVISNQKLIKDFRYFMKQKGGLLAKGRLLGIQFVELLEDGLYFDIAKHAVDMAMKIREAFIQNGFKMFVDSYTNQQFPIVPNDELKILQEKYIYSFWEKYDDNHSVVRFCTSWATDEKNVDELVKDLANL